MADWKPKSWAPSTFQPDAAPPPPGPKEIAAGEEPGGFGRGVARGGWAIPGLVGLDYETAQGAEYAVRDPMKLADRGMGLTDRFKFYRDLERERSQRAEKENPIKTGLGIGAGSAPSMLLMPQAKTAEGASLGARALASGLTAGAQSAAVEGGVTGALPPEERVKRMGAAGATGLGLGALAPVATSAVPSPVADWLGGKAEKLAVRSTGADRTAARAAGMGKGSPNAAEKVSDIGRFLLDEKVPLRTPQAMKEGLSDVLAQEGPQIGNLTRQAEQSGAKVDFMTAAQNAMKDPAVANLIKNTETRPLWSRVQAFLQDQLQQNGKQMTPTKAHELRQQLDALSQWSQQNPKELADAYRAVRGSLSDEIGNAMQRAGLADEWAGANARFSKAATARKLADVGAERRTGNALFSPTEKFGGGIGAALAAVGHGPAGAALAGGTVLAKRFGAPIGARSLDALSNALKSNPQQFGQYANGLLAAAERGPEALAAAHYVLSHSSPEYRARFSTVSANEEGQ